MIVQILLVSICIDDIVLLEHLGPPPSSHNPLHTLLYTVLLPAPHPAFLTSTLWLFTRVWCISADLHRAH